MSEILDGILKMKAVLEAMKPVFYYATADDVPRGQILLSEKTKYTPRFFVCHPDDLERIKGEMVGARLVHLREYVPTPDDFLDADVALEQGHVTPNE